MTMEPPLKLLFFLAHIHEIHPFCKSRSERGWIDGGGFEGDNVRPKGPSLQA